jgi:hypothetical protein
LNIYRFRVLLFPPLGLDLDLGVAPFGLDLDLGVAPFGLDLDLGVAPFGLALDLESPTRRNKQNREMDDTIMLDGSTYLILLVRLNIVLSLLGRFLIQSIASKLVSGLYERTIPPLTSCAIFTAAVLLSVSRYALNETAHLELFNKSER